jgi:hypothetical protein
MLSQYGYDLGFLPVVRFLRWDDSTQDFREAWRGQAGFQTGNQYTLAEWSTASEFRSWLDDYKRLFKRVLGVYLKNGVNPSTIYVGSEMQHLINLSSDPVRTEFIEGMIDLAEWSKNKVPSADVTYAANWGAYRSGGDYVLDRLWSHPALTKVGIECYFPLTREHTNEENKLVEGMNKGEYKEYGLDGKQESERRLQTSSNNGLVGPNISKGEINISNALKGVTAFREYAHYVPRPGDGEPAASPLKGRQVQGPQTCIDLAGSGATVETSAKEFAESAVQPPLARNQSWLALGQGAETAVPTITNNETGYELVFDLDAATTNDFARLFRADGVIDVQMDATSIPEEVKAEVFHGSTSTFTEGLFFPADQRRTLKLKVDRTANKITFIINGEKVKEKVFSTTPKQLSGTPTANVMAYSAGSQEWDGKLYYAHVKVHEKGEERDTGAKWHFDDSYAGRRTSWVPGQTEVIATEFGFASMNGSCLEPNVFPVAYEGSDSLPEWRDKPFWEYVRSELNRQIDDLRGPHGTNFEFDELHQHVALNAMREALKGKGIEKTVLYTIDSRPMRALYSLREDTETGTTGLWFIDGPRQNYAHAINGKLTEGSNFVRSTFDFLKTDRYIDGGAASEG